MGEGSFGKVYLAVQKGTKKQVAVKVLDKYHIMKVTLVVDYIASIIKSKVCFARETCFRNFSIPASSDNTSHFRIKQIFTTCLSMQVKAV